MDANSDESSRISEASIAPHGTDHAFAERHRTAGRRITMQSDASATIQFRFFRALPSLRPNRTASASIVVAFVFRSLHRAVYRTRRPTRRTSTTCDERARTFSTLPHARAGTLVTDCSRRFVATQSSRTGAL